MCGNKIPDNVIVNEKNRTLSIDFASDSIYFGIGSRFKIYFVSRYTNDSVNKPEYSESAIWNEKLNEITSKLLSSKDMEFLNGLKIMYQDSRLNLVSKGELVKCEICSN